MSAIGETPAPDADPARILGSTGSALMTDSGRRRIPFWRRDANATTPLTMEQFTEGGLWVPAGTPLPPPSNGQSRDEAALDLAHKQWEAEQENSRRLAARANGVLASFAALSGLGLFQFRELAGIPSDPVGILARVAVALAVLLILIGLIHVWDVRPPPRAPTEKWWQVLRKAVRYVRRRTSLGPESEAGSSSTAFASAWLHSSTPGEPSVDLITQRARDVREIAFYRLSAAAGELHRRNISRRIALQTGQNWIGRGVTVALLGLLPYVLFGRAEKSAPSPASNSVKIYVSR